MPAAETPETAVTAPAAFYHGLTPEAFAGDASFDPASFDRPPEPARPEPAPRNRLRSTTGYHLPGASVLVIDDPQALGVKFDLPAGEKPPAEALEAVKSSYGAGDRKQPPLVYKPLEKLWAKRPSGDTKGDRLEVESRAKTAAERLRESRSSEGHARG